MSREEAEQSEFASKVAGFLVRLRYFEFKLAVISALMSIEQPHVTTYPSENFFIT